jgi:ABC-type dipeptide/oligopeptide/nickel transport system permease component
MLLFAACVMLTASMIGEILLALFDPRTRLD